ncbi:MAG: DUF547 domain-containing protein [Terriglobia bacterium]
MKRTSLALVILLLATQSSAPSAARIDEASYAQTLQKYVSNDGRVDYAALKKNHAGLDSFIQEISATSPANAPRMFSTRAEQLAYWINAYNAWVLKIVVDHYPIESITKIGLIPFSAFYVDRITLGDKSMTLNTLETGVLRSGFHEPRIHFAINCASRSCPPLARQAYRAETLDQQLNAAARNFVNDNRNVTLDEAHHRIVLSMILKWYAKDFESAVPSSKKATVLDYLKTYLTPQRQTVLSHLQGAAVAYHPYDWSLNGK